MTTATKNSQGTKKILVTSHARDRWSQRTMYSRRKEDIKKAACKARYDVPDVDSLTLEDVNNNSKLLNYLQSSFKHTVSTDKIKYYNGFVFIFCGQKSRTLRTIVNVPEDVLAG